MATIPYRPPSGAAQARPPEEVIVVRLEEFIRQSATRLFDEVPDLSYDGDYSRVRD